MRDLLLVGAIVVHRPDFFVSAALADEIDLGFGNAGHAAAEAKDDFIGKAVRDYAGSFGRGISLYCLPSTCGDCLVLDVVEPALHHDFAGGHAQIAERQHGSVRRRGIPVLRN